MRKLNLLMSISLDGFVSGSEGDVKWIFNGDQEAIASKVEQARNASLHIMGSRTFRSMASYWPTASGPFAEPMNRIPKAVFSKSGTEILKPSANETPAVQHQTGAESWAQAYVAGGDLAKEIAQLKALDGKPIVAHGGATFARSLIAENLVDEYVLLVHPIALGKGASIFSALPAPRSLKLVASKWFSSGTVMQIYRPQV